jgi:hypothetical protein
MTVCHQPTGAVPDQILVFPCGTLNVTGSEVVTLNIAVTREIIAAQGKSSLSPVSPLKSLPLLLRAIGVWGCHLSPVTVVTGDRSNFSLSASRVGGACNADQTGGDGNSVACNRKPFAFRKFQIGVPYRSDETQPCDDSAGERDPKYLDCSKGRGQSHSQSLPALCVEMVAGRGYGGGVQAKSGGLGRGTGARQNLPKSQINVLRWSIWPGRR